MPGSHWRRAARRQWPGRARDPLGTDRCRRQSSGC